MWCSEGPVAARWCIGTPLAVVSSVVTSPSFPVARTTLDNGLRVVVSPDRSAPVVAVAVYYDVGIRSEPQGRTGFAHLFEHLMFQGSVNLEKLAHFRYVQASGGTFNGSTHLDYTNYFEVLPSNALERALFLEADRMRGPRLTEENLANQIAVVKEEIRVNVMNRPYGGFPWLWMPEVLFDTFPNSHNGYGDFVDLENATVADAEDFFHRYYAPANAVLTIVGDVDADEALGLAGQYFGDIPSRDAPQRPDFAEPDLSGRRRSTHPDIHAPSPAVAAAWRVPNPMDLAAYLPFVVLNEVLTDGDAARLRRRLVSGDRLATALSGYIGLMGDPFDVRDPTAYVVQAHHPSEVGVDRLLAAMQEELDALATHGLEPGELDRVRNRLTADLMRGVDGVLPRALSMAVAEQQRGDARLLERMPELLRSVAAESVREAAATLQPHRCAVLEVVPGGGPSDA